MKAQRFLHADSGGTHPAYVKMLPIRQHLKTSSLKPGPKAVLMEVCELHENGGKGSCFISNDELAKNLGISLATATRTVKTLVAAGLLTSRVVKAEANRRYLAPTPLVRACYTGGTVAAQLLAASNLTIVKNEAEPELTIVKSESDYSQNSQVTIVKNDADYSQTASRVYGDKQDKHSTSNEELASAQAELLAAQQKIAELQSELAEVTHQRDQLRHTLKAQRVGSAHQGGGAAPADALHFTAFAQSPYATAEGFAQLATALGYPKAFAPFYAAQVGQKAPQEEPRTLEGWQRYVKRWLHNDAEKGRLQTTDPNESTHVNSSTFSQQRPAAGAKPTGQGSQLARALAERRAGK